MKKNILKITLIGAIALTSIESYAVSANTELIVLNAKTEVFKVYGNCGMCEKTIEGSLKGVKGIEKADWNKETKMIEVTFNGKEISLDEIKKKIASVGYDTEEYRATKKAYNSLPGCCQYDRPAEKKKEDTHKGHQH
jgi:periplasmic mercuric ion binding protein